MTCSHFLIFLKIGYIQNVTHFAQVIFKNITLGLPKTITEHVLSLNINHIIVKYGTNKFQYFYR